MSVKVKKCVDALRTYLGKDKKGIELLDTLKNAANELRKKLAAAEERLQQVEAVKDAARERADAAETARTELHRHNHDLQQRVTSLQQAVAATVGVKSLRPPCGLPQISVEGLRDVFYSVRQSCSRPKVHDAAVVAGKNVLVYDLADMLPEWTDDAFLRLGRLVTMLATSTEYIMIAADAVEYTADNHHTFVSRKSLGAEILNWHYGDDTGDRMRDAEFDSNTEKIAAKYKLQHKQEMVAEHAEGIIGEVRLIQRLEQSIVSDKDKT